MQLELVEPNLKVFMWNLNKITVLCHTFLCMSLLIKFGCNIKKKGRTVQHNSPDVSDISFYGNGILTAGRKLV